MFWYHNDDKKITIFISILIQVTEDRNLTKYKFVFH